MVGEVGTNSDGIGLLPPEEVRPRHLNVSGECMYLAGMEVWFELPTRSWFFCMNPPAVTRQRVLSTDEHSSKLLIVLRLLDSFLAFGTGVWY